MSIFAIIMPFEHIISEQFNGSIWRIEIDGLTEIIFVEIRDNENKKVHFAAISLRSGQLLIKDLTTPERWLTGIEAAYNGVLLLHFYQTDTGPVHKGLMAIDALTAKVLWSNYALTFDHLSVNGPVVYDARIQPLKLFLADIKTGATTSVFESSVNKELKNEIEVPKLISPDDLPVGIISTQPFGNSVHYLEYNNFRIVSLHALKAGVLTQWLYIFDGLKMIYEDILNNSIQKMQPESFIFHSNRLIYIKNKSELKVLSL